MLAYLREIAPGRSNAETMRLVNDRFGLSLTLKQIKAGKKNHNITSGLTGHFPKDHEPFNKGRKQSEYMTADAINRTKPTQFKTGDKPANYRPVGSERIDNKDGYIVMKVRDKGTWPERWRHKHCVIWEQAHGEIPDGHMVIFLNGDKTDIRLENLALISRASNARMNQSGLRFDDPDLTAAGINIANLITATGKIRRASP